MADFRGTVDRNERGDLETAYFTPSWHNDGVSSQSVSIAPLKNNEVSIIFNKTQKIAEIVDYNFIHFIFVEKEVDMLIDALVECKKRWTTGQVIK